MRVKICGVTRPEDARAAVELGAWAIGMILSPRGPRYLERDRARRVRDAIPEGTLAVGVFVDESAERVNELARELGLDMVQLHGSEPPEILARLERPAIKAFALGPATDRAVPDLAPWKSAWGALLEGTERGRPFDWRLVPGSGERILLAGGLTPENAARAARVPGVHALDVSSGVESRPGEKSRAKLEAFFSALRAAGDPRGAGSP
jgi:phosphoribosylanthranilate isomerase